MKKLLKTSTKKLAWSVYGKFWPISITVIQKLLLGLFILNDEFYIKYLKYSMIPIYF